MSIVKPLWLNMYLGLEVAIRSGFREVSLRFKRDGYLTFRWYSGMFVFAEVVGVCRRGR